MLVVLRGLGLVGLAERDRAQRDDEDDDQQPDQDALQEPEERVAGVLLVHQAVSARGDGLPVDGVRVVPERDGEHLVGRQRHAVDQAVRGGTVVHGRGDAVVGERDLALVVRRGGHGLDGGGRGGGRRGHAAETEQSGQGERGDDDATTHGSQSLTHELSMPHPGFRGSARAECPNGRRTERCVDFNI